MAHVLIKFCNHLRSLKGCAGNCEHKRAESHTNEYDTLKGHLIRNMHTLASLAAVRKVPSRIQSRSCLPAAWRLAPNCASDDRKTLSSVFGINFRISTITSYGAKMLISLLSGRILLWISHFSHVQFPSNKLLEPYDLCIVVECTALSSIYTRSSK